MAISWSELKKRRAKLVSVSVHSPAWKWPHYARFANAAQVAWLWFTIEWRMPWLRDAVWSEAWDAGWRAGREALRNVQSMPRWDVPE